MLDNFYFKENYKLTAIDLSKQQFQPINFTAGLDRDDGATILFIIEKAKEAVFEFSQGTLKVL